MITDETREVDDMVVLVDFPDLKAADRCDRCGAQAFVITRHLAGYLYWCKHHFEKHQELLVSSGDTTKALAVCDRRDTINKDASISASS